MLTLYETHPALGRKLNCISTCRCVCVAHFPLIYWYVAIPFVNCRESIVQCAPVIHIHTTRVHRKRQHLNACCRKLLVSCAPTWPDACASLVSSACDTQPALNACVFVPVFENTPHSVSARKLAQLSRKFIAEVSHLIGRPDSPCKTTCFTSMLCLCILYVYNITRFDML